MGSEVKQVIQFLGIKSGAYSLLSVQKTYFNFSRFHVTRNWLEGGIEGERCWKEGDGEDRAE